MTSPSLPGTENPRKPGSPDFVLIIKTVENIVNFAAFFHDSQCYDLSKMCHNVAEYDYNVGKGEQSSYDLIKLER